MQHSFWTVGSETKAHPQRWDNFGNRRSAMDRAGKYLTLPYLTFVTLIVGMLIVVGQQSLLLLPLFTFTNYMYTIQLFFFQCILQFLMSTLIY